MIQNNLADVPAIFLHAFLGVYLMMLTEFREPVRVWRRRWGIAAAAVIAANALICIIFGRDVWTNLTLLTFTVPFVAVTLCCSMHKWLYVMFSICTCMWIGCVVFSAAKLACATTGGDLWLRFLTQAAAYAVMCFVVLRFRQYYFRMIRLLDKGWGVLCAIPAVTFVTVLYILSCLPQEYTAVAFVSICGITILCTCSYVLIYLFFVKIINDHELRNKRDIAEIRRYALERQLDESKTAEASMTAQCRDMQNRWETLARLVENGDSAAVEEIVGAAQRRLNGSAEVRWCENRMLNAMFAVYFSKAKNRGIEVDARLDIPEKLPMPPAELSTVFANALENAVNACMEVPTGKRKIICRCVSSPMLMLKIENTMRGEVRFGSSGLPVSSKEGHGIGTQSIAAFCRKYDAVWSCDVSDGWFCLRIAI